jgi:DNA-binding MarR family transcriptional regulator
LDDPGTGSLLFDAFVLGQRIRRFLTTAMASSPLRPEEYAVYSVVFERESISPTSMAEALGMPLTTVAEHVRAMEERGHVRRMSNPADGRSYLLVLNAAGLRAHREANVLFEAAYARFVDALPRGERAARAAMRPLLDAAAQVLAVESRA